MKQHITASRLFILTVSGIIGSLVGCSPEQTFSGPPQNGNPQGGDSSQNSSNGEGGNPSATGGTTAAASSTTAQQSQGGNATSTGGTNADATGGATDAATGGKSSTSATGGTKASTGGTKASTGGTKASTGGTKASTGGKAATGGVATGDGGAEATGGAPPSTSTAAPTTCTFGSAVTVTTADGYVSTADTAANGTCGGYSFSWTAQCKGTAVGDTTISPCTDASTTKCPATITEKKFTTTGGLCATGSISGCDDYSATIGFGFNLNQLPASSSTGSLAQSGTGLQIAFSGTKPTTLRVQVSDDSGAAKGDYCYDVSASTSPVKIPWGSFAYQCWDTTAAVPLKSSAVITKVQFIVASAETKASTFSDLCITKVSTY